MLTRGSDTLTWDAENRLISDNATSATFVYDGDGNRVKKIENGETILYINRYYEVNVTSGNTTSYYYLGSQLIAASENGTLRYIHQDSLTSTSLMTDSAGSQIGTTVKYLPFGETRSGSIPTDKLFTGQRLDNTGLYFYNARYYDPTIGRFISPDMVIQNPANPQCFNRYSYGLNNPLKYIDPSGNNVEINDINMLLLDAYNKDPLGFSMYFAYFSTKELVNLQQTANSDEYQAYNTLRSADTLLTQVFENDENILVKIVGANLNWSPTGYTGGETSRTGNIIDIKIQNDPKANVSVNDATKFLSHELIHGYINYKEPGVKNSQFGENLGDIYSYHICTTVGIPYTDLIVSPFDSAALAQKYANHNNLKKGPFLPANTNLNIIDYYFMYKDILSLYYRYFP